uniref:PLAT domain-containing protein n=1 Tax=Mola mola TaxID=94237 RepID=A0A3Q3VVE1_MOLML
MGSKDTKSKDGKRKKKPRNDDDEEPLVEPQEGEDSKKKKKKKAKKESADSEEDKKKKGKKSKNKQVDYAAIYQNELLNYHTDSSDGYEDEYYKKKVYEVVTVTGDVKGAGTDANVFVTLFGEFGVTPKVHLASNIIIETSKRDLLGSLNPMDIPKLNKYLVSVFTADMKGSGTDADVFLNIFGEYGDTGERRLDSDKDNFERGSEDNFTIEAPNLGRLRKITIGHNNRGSSAGWFLDKVVIDDMGNKEMYLFPVNRWFAMDEDDGKIQRDVLVGSTEFTCAFSCFFLGIIYNVQVMTGDVRGAGTNSKIHIVMHGSKGLKNSGKIFLEGGAFERGLIDIFNVEICELISPLSRVTIGHDNGAVGAGWYCEKVVVYCPFTGIEQTFQCGMWLDEDEGDGLIERELYEMVSLRQKKQKKYLWSLWIWTSDVKGAGTDAQVFLQIYGEKGKSDEIKLESNSDSFEQAQLDKFMIEMPDVGRLLKLRIWHEKRHPFSGWHLAKVTLLKTLTMEKYSFHCGRWLDVNEDDNEIIRELPATGALIIIKYRVTICTGNVSGSGTDASVFLNMIGDLGDIGERLMIMSKNNVNKFEKGNHDEFLIESVSLGQVRRVRVGHDGRGGGCGWFLDKVMVREEGQPEPSAIEFPCFRWLDRNEDDGQIVRELVPAGDGLRLFSKSIKTGSVNGASSDSKVFVKLYGEKGNTNKITLSVSDNDLRNYFETGRTDSFTIETFDIGQASFPDLLMGKWRLRSIPVRSWTLKNVKVYRSTSRSNNFERGTTEIFKIEAQDVGKLYKIRIYHDGSGICDGWFLETVDIKRLTMVVETFRYFFPCKRWLAIDEDDGQLARELVPVDEAFMRKGDEDYEDSEATLGLEQKAMSTTYRVRIKTGDKKYAGTDANVFMILYGTKDDTGMINLKASKTHKNKFERGMTDEFTVEAVDIGPPKKLRIGHDNCGSAGWFLDWVEIDAQSLGQKLRFPCGRWLDKGEDDGAIVRDLFPNLLQTEIYTPFVPYEIKVFTSDMFGAGTDADVFIVLYGRDAVCTQQKSLCVNKRERRMYFERGAEDMFIVELADVGDVIEKIRIGHDNRGVNPGWHLDRVEIRRLLRKGKGSETVIFPCERWLAKSEDDGETARELVPSDIITEKLSQDGNLKVTEVEVEDALETHTYKVSVMTGDVYGAGTDANVFLTIYGDQGDTGERKLRKSETNSNKFERGCVDTFTIEAVDLGQVFRIKIRHDNSMMSADWYLDQVEVLDEDTEEVFLFLCERWLSRKKEDRRIERVFYVKVEIRKLHIARPFVIPYHVTICTGLERDASTTSRAYVIIIGASYTQTERLWLDPPDGRRGFEAGSLESFESLGSDVGEIKKVELGHDGATPESCWLVDELSVAVPTKGVKYVFACKCWLAKDRGDGLTARVFNVLDAEAISISKKVIYEVTVVTGDVQNAGTDTLIYMTVFGSNGSTEEMLLHKNEDRFERGQEDTFNMEIDDIAPLRKMRLRIDGSGSRPDWFLDQVITRNLTTEDVSVFTYEEWLSRTRGTKICEMAAVVDEEMMVELTTYIIQVKTSAITGSGTDANVWIIIFGENGDSGTLALKESNKSNKFERKQVDTFHFSDILSLGELSKVRVWHDNSGVASGWHLDYIEVKDEILDKTFRFPCDRWLAKNDDDGQIMRELACANDGYLDLNEKTKYEICITTGDTGDAETKENAWIVLEGRKGQSKEFVMENSSKKKRFLRGNVDKFEFSSKNLGDIAGICLGHTPKDGKKVKGEVYWLVKEVVITEKELGNKYIFVCNARIPLSPKRNDFLTFECTKSIESFASKARSLVPVKYEIIIITGDEKGAGTDANVFITIYGTNGDSGRRQLRQKFRNLFERGHTDRFLLEMLDMGELQKVQVEHDNTGLNPGWLLDRVEVTNTANGVTTIFLCGKWLHTKRADGQIVRVVYPKY